MAYNPFDMGNAQDSGAMDKTPMDDLEIPEGEDLDFEQMSRTIRDIDTTQAISSSDTAEPTPNTPRPNLPPSQDSQAPFIPVSPEITRRNQAPHEVETSDDPDDDVMSMNTDINRHERTLSTISQQIREIMKKIDMIPDVDNKIRSLSKSNAEMESRFTKVSQEMENLRKSFNMYQSSTANKIADVERRAAEHQLVSDPVADPGIIPPAEIHLVRDPAPDMNRQSDTIGRSAVEPVMRKKKAVVADW